MLTLFRSNRAELLASVLAANISLNPPDVLEQAQVVVNTWPTSRWLGEQLALNNPAGIAANLRFPFPTSLLRQLVDQLLQPEIDGSGPDPWRAQNLVWPLLEALPELLEHPNSTPIQHWLEERAVDRLDTLDTPLWQLARAIADAIDDYGLYRPAMVEAWLAGHNRNARGQSLPDTLLWQPQLVRQLHQHLGCLPFGLRARQLIRRLQQGWTPQNNVEQPLRLFGLSSLAPIQVELLQALSAIRSIELYLLTPCKDLWQRQQSDISVDPLAADWLLSVPGLEARFGRLGAEFQQLLEGSGETQLGSVGEQDLFFLATAAADHNGRTPTLLEHLQDHLIDGKDAGQLPRQPDDLSLQWHACPGRLRQLQVIRDQLLQLLASDDSLEPRDILVMTPQVEAFAPLVGAVFGDSEATGVQLPWRLTDRSQQSEPGLSQAVLQLLTLGGERLTASALETLMANPALLTAHQLNDIDAEAITQALQRAGFRWGLDQTERSGDPTHSLSWAIDRMLLGLVLPTTPGLAPAATAPMPLGGSLEQQSRWIALLQQLLRSLRWLKSSRPVKAWVDGLRDQLSALFGDGGTWAWELQTLHAALSDWQAIAGDSELSMAAPVVAEVLAERLSEGSGRFGHRSGALTISALEPMRAIPHKVVVLMGLDAGAFPRQRQRPGFHLMEQQRLLGDPNSSDQDRYVLLEAVLSARQHLLVSWSCRDERTGEHLEASTPVRQLLDLLPQVPVREHAANPLERNNFLPAPPWPPSSCDQRLLEVRRHLEQGHIKPTAGLASTTAAVSINPEPSITAWDDLLGWLKAPQKYWLEQLGLRPREHHTSVLDLESLNLDEQMRASLLRRELEAKPSTSEPADSNEVSTCPNWLALERGRGVLPPLSAGTLEAARLEQRWTSLEFCLSQLGPQSVEEVAWEDFTAALTHRGEQLVLVHTAKPRTPQRLQLWLQLLLAQATNTHLATGVLVGRDGNRFRVLERINAPPKADATALLEQISSWRQTYRERCWPVPPETGWAFVSGVAKGRGWSKAKETWEGTPLFQGERLEAVQQMCFGSDRPVQDVLDEQCQALALALYQPLMERRQELKK